MRKFLILVFLLSASFNLYAQNVAQPDSITPDTVLDTADETITIGLDGKDSATLQIDSVSSPSLTLNAGVSADNGTTFHETDIRFITPIGDINSTLTNPGVGLYGIIIPSGGTHVRVRVSSYTSGSVTGNLSATSAQATQPLTADGLTVGANFAFQLFGGKDGTTARAVKMSSGSALFSNLRDAAGNEIASGTASPSVTARGLAVRSTVGHVTYNSPTFATVGVSSAQALASNTSRKGLILKNTSNNKISCAIGTTAVLDSGLTLEAGDAFTMTEYTTATGAVNCIASAASSNLSIQETQ